MMHRVASLPWLAFLAALTVSPYGSACAQDTSAEGERVEPSSDIAVLESLIGQRVSIELHSGRRMKDVELVGLERTRAGDPRRLAVSERGRLRRLAISTVAEVESDGEPVYIAPQDRKSSRDRATDRSPSPSPKPKVQSEKERQAWLSRLAARNIEPWKTASDKEHKEAMDGYRKMIGEIQQLLPGIELYETERFLFTSNIPRQQIAPYVEYLDEMYNWMCRLYGIPLEQEVWLGRKAPVFAFLNEQEFQAYEAKYFQHHPQGIYGLCHQSAAGHVIIACYRGDDPNDFGQMLVHETSHGFIHRYKTKARLPNWVNEGMAEYIGAQMVPKSESVRRKEMIALAELRRGTPLGDFFTAEAIRDWQYGVASSMNRFMLETNPDSYVRFIEALKEGIPWVEALQLAYGSKPEELLQAYGEQIRVPDLRL